MIYILSPRERYMIARKQIYLLNYTREQGGSRKYDNDNRDPKHAAAVAVAIIQGNIHFKILVYHIIILLYIIQYFNLRLIMEIEINTLLALVQCINIIYG